MNSDVSLNSVETDTRLDISTRRRRQSARRWLSIARRRASILLASAALALACAAPHTASAELLRFDITDLDLSIFGNAFFAEYGAPSVGHVNHAALRLVYESGENVDAALMQIGVEAPTTGLPTWVVSGAELGWAGQGRFEAVVETDKLNGEFIGDEQTLFTFLSISLGMTDGSRLGGRFIESALLLEYTPYTVLTVAPDPLRAGEPATFSATGLKTVLVDPNAYLVYSTRGRGLTFAPPLFIHTDLASPLLAATTIPDANGEGSWLIDVPPGAAGRRVWVQSLQEFHKSNVLALEIK